MCKDCAHQGETSKFSDTDLRNLEHALTSTIAEKTGQTERTFIALRDKVTLMRRKRRLQILAEMERISRQTAGVLGLDEELRRVREGNRCD